jgi:predicted cupin superfamily sugar epimerase
MTQDDHGRRRFLGAAALTAAGLTVPGAATAQRSPGAEETHPMTGSLTAEEIRILLGLQPNQTCGYVRETYRSGLELAAGALPPPFEAARPVGTGLYFMMTPAEPVKLHRIRNDQLYHYYLGDPIEVLMLHLDGTAAKAVVGPDLRAGQRVQLFIPGGTSTPPASSTRAPSSSGRAPSGPASFPPTWRSATPKPSPRSIPPSPRISAPSRCRSPRSAGHAQAEAPSREIEASSTSISPSSARRSSPPDMIAMTSSRVISSLR